MCKVQINIESVFAKLESAIELKEVAQSAVNQINVAYKKRLVELMSDNASETVDVTVDGGNATKPKKSEKVASNKSSRKAVKATETDKTADKKPSKEVVKQVSISSLTKAQIKAMDLKFEKYSDKCMFLTGNTRCIKDEIMATGGAHWNGKRQGWFVKNDTAKEIAKALKIKIA